MRVVFDTNVLIDGFSDDFSVHARLIDAVLEEGLTAVSSHATEREYRLILRRLIAEPQYRERIEAFLALTERVEPVPVEIVIDDPEDQKFIETAVAGQAELLITQDRHLLDIGEVAGVRILRPQEAWAHFEDERGSSSEWESWARGLGLL